MHIHAAILRDNAIAYVPGSDTQIVVQAMRKLKIPTYDPHH
ncbi:hypothetical protein BBJK_00017 [Bifidobacterium bifidum LMG 13195]|uniref:Uncharacterized protein n=1 Tax=Bifidobacterium bifidum LMG 13195 TaxID=1207542 RepID=A0A286TB07_BIFBI|nr:hypothetical protein BBJK_00017 [Bifidobacterium bifidum LMG 13195]